MTELKQNREMRVINERFPTYNHIAYESNISNVN